MKYVFIAGICILLIFLGVLYFIPLGIEPLTEVYFENHTTLRANIFPNQFYNFSFTIHNLEYQDMAYNYNISVFDVNGTLFKTIHSGRVEVPDNNTVTIFESYKLEKKFGRAQIKVIVDKDHLNITPEFKTKLWWPDPNYPEQIDIHFWVDEIAGVTITHI